MAKTGGFARVKEVVSGDTLVLVGQPNNAPPPEIRLTLASLQAPKLAKPNSPDEPFAFQSREFLRKLCIGKRVSFKIEYAVQSIGRSFGAVYLLENGLPQENLCITVARAGWARVKEAAGKQGSASDSEKSGDYEEMVSASSFAQQEGYGLFNTDPVAIEQSVRKLTWEVDAVESFYNKIKSTPQKCIIEYVRDGAGMKALLVQHMTYINFNLAGIQCPRLHATKGADSESGPESFAEEAKFFTEIRLLHREVALEITGLGEKNKMIYASVIHPSGNISVELAKNGLATPDWSMIYTTPSNAAAIQAAVRLAKKHNLRIWKNYSAPVIPGETKFEGVVAEVISGDTILVRVGTADSMMSAPWECEERRISLSSIRAPRRGARDSQDEPLSNESKDFLRSKLVGKKCSVNVEYVNEIPGAESEGKTSQVRKYATVLVQLKRRRANAAALILEEGLASLISHKPNTERSEFYHELMEAENKAKEQKKGIWGKTPVEEASRTKAIELNTPALAKSYLPTLQQSKGTISGVVEYVVNGARMRIFVPKLNCIVSFALAGISAPNVGRGKQGDDTTKTGKNIQAQPYGNEALSFSRALVLQREVDIEVEAMDRGGTAIGTLLVKVAGQKENLAVLLLRHGLAKCVYFSANQSRHKDALFAAEEEAKLARLRVWKDYVEEAEVEVPNVSSKGSKIETFAASVCDVVNGNTLFLRKRSSLSSMESINAAMVKLGEEYGTTPKDTTSIMDPQKGQSCIALFDDGNGPRWYRAKIQSVTTKGAAQTLRIRYIDFGNEETVEKTRVRKAVDPSLFSIEPLAIEASLAFINVPSLDEDYGRDAAVFLSECTLGKEFEVKVHGKDDQGRLKVTLSKTDDKNTTVNGLLLREGLATLPRKLKVWKDEETEIVKKLQEDQEVAHNEHINLWVYGDPREDDDDQRF